MQRFRIVQSATFVLGVFAASPLLSAAGRYAIESVLVTNGHPVKGVEGGVIFEQYFDATSKLYTERSLPGDKPIAATVGTTLNMEITVGSQEPGNPEDPNVVCGWAVLGVGPRVDAWDSGIHLVSWIGRESALEVKVPERTGIYEFSLTCQINDAPHRDVVERILFATYGAPLDLGTAPEPDWYRRACDWGAGFTAQAREGDVLKAMLDGVYRYGQAHWRYGSFDNVVRQGGSDNYRPECGTSGWCQCSWQQLVAEKTSCNFANCYQFSEVLQFTASILGIGVLQPTVIKGENGVGFVTPPNVPSLDPRFIGNIHCWEGECPSYLFSSHSLRLRDGVYYDATFNRTYASPSEPIYESIELAQDGAKKLTSIDDMLCPVATVYGGWHNYLPPSAQVVACPAPMLSSDNSRAAFTDQIEFFQVNTDADGVFEEIGVDVGVRVDVPGHYVVKATLHDRDGYLVAHRPTARSADSTKGFVPRFEGQHTVRLIFSGEEISIAGKSGPYTMKAQLVSDDGVLGRLSVNTPTDMDLGHHLFGERDAEIVNVITVRGADDAFDDRYSALKVTLELAGQTEESFYLLHARVSKNGETLAYGTLKFNLETSSQEVVLDFQGRREGLFRSDESYDLTIQLIDSDLKTVHSKDETVEVLPPLTSDLGPHARSRWKICNLAAHRSG